eukprot:NODE_512_length_1587_cov_153.259428_g390_i0.p1 GENE.NODE_512_length_1587_cov_153.259428_g390_i0~~NODE_512_length_1587_cov_153.259428_g390_i0.p1  ORF type:complete len:480 (+),score=135.01 NODE_512_length_1587_cov_153.259428_g390_i0:78-1442(+)
MASLEETYTSPDHVPSVVAGLRATFISGFTLPLAFRKAQLTALLHLMSENVEVLAEAVKADLGRHPKHSRQIIAGCVASTQLCIDKLDEWAAPQALPPAGGNQCTVRSCPRGVVLIIGTWNFPNPLVWKPLASALAAGNTVLVKLSELSANTSRVMAGLITKYMDPRCVQVVQGGVPLITEVLQQKFDLIFFTGNSRVGRVVLRAASEHLTPCVLEMGGKNPVVVAEDANIPVAARKIVDGRFKNAGQFCVAPDYVLCTAKVKDALLKEMKAAVEEFFSASPSNSESFARLISTQHCQRVASLLDDAHGGTLLTGGAYDVAARYVAPTIVVDPIPTSKMMQEEIFGPVLPVLTVADIPEALRFVNERPEPLALYVFSANSATVDTVIASTRSGGACANDVIIHMLNEVLPFGGLGESGMGSYHGTYGFRAFSHEKGVLVVDSEHSGTERFPPYS